MYRGCRWSGTHQCATVSRMTLWQSANPFCVGWSVLVSVSSCPSSCFTLIGNREYLHPCSTGSPVLSRHRSLSFQLARSNSLQSFGGMWVFSPMKSLINMFFISFEISSHFSCLLLAMSESILFTNGNLFLSLKIDQFRMLSRLDITAIFATGYTLYFVSAVL